MLVWTVDGWGLGPREEAIADIGSGNIPVSDPKTSFDSMRQPFIKFHKPISPSRRRRRLSNFYTNAHEKERGRERESPTRLTRHERANFITP